MAKKIIIGDLEIQGNISQDGCNLGPSTKLYKHTFNYSKGTSGQAGYENYDLVIISTDNKYSTKDASLLLLANPISARLINKESDICGEFSGYNSGHYYFNYGWIYVSGTSNPNTEVPTPTFYQAATNIEVTFTKNGNNYYINITGPIYERSVTQIQLTEHEVEPMFEQPEPEPDPASGGLS